MTDDAGLLRKYAETGAEDAFSELVRRHLPLVYSAALRQVFGSEAMAEDVAQTVFIDLARKAACLAGRDVLAGWLYSSTRLAAYKAMRGEHRRQRRERIAAASMREDNQYPPTEQAEIRLVLDDAMSKLSPRDRNALLLRFFESKDFKGVGAALGLSEDAARMRVTRALEKLTALMSKRGVTVSGGALGMVLATEAAMATPPGLAASISAVATTSVSAGAATTALVKLLSLTKFKAALISAVLVAGIVTPILVEHRTSGRLRASKLTLPAQPVHSGLPAPGAERTSENATVAQPVAGRSGLVERETRPAKFRAEGAQSPNHAEARVSASAAQNALVTSKIALLKEWLAKMPEKNIPEIQLCAEEDWVGSVRVFDLKTEEGARRALANLRNCAKTRLAKTMVEAVRKYSSANEHRLPANLAELKSYLDPEAGDSFLDRYEIRRNGKTGQSSAAEWAAVEKATVDRDYDTIHEIGVYGYTCRRVELNMPGTSR